MEAKSETLPISRIHLNTGQVPNLPKNPRFIRDERFKALCKSIEDAPEMLSLREILVYDNGGEYVIIGGNMRFRACREIGLKEIPCKILPQDTPADKLREYTIKDNAFMTRGYDQRLDSLKGELEIAREISGKENPNLIVYGGGKKVKEFCAANNLVYTEQFMNGRL